MIKGRRVLGMGLLLAELGGLIAADAAAQELSFSKSLTPSQAHCLDDLLRTSYFKYSPSVHLEMKQIVQVATAKLDGPGRRQYVYLFESFGFCGTAGCSMAVGEEEHDGLCRLLYAYYSNGTFTVLPKRDHGYHRFWSPCEARYDGRQYQLLHPDCPNAVVRH
jgi:hypothetical protein